MKHQVLFSLKNNEKILMNVVCCSRDWRFKVKAKTNLPLLYENQVLLCFWSDSNDLVYVSPAV